MPHWSLLTLLMLSLYPCQKISVNKLLLLFALIQLLLQTVDETDAATFLQAQSYRLDTYHYLSDRARSVRDRLVPAKEKSPSLSPSPVSLEADNVPVEIRRRLQG